jgi:capsular exopolysaccharide synthesis family protein
MSRLYEALKGASRSRGNGNGNAHDRLLDALDVNGMQLPSAYSAAIEEPQTGLVLSLPLNGHGDQPASSNDEPASSKAVVETQAEGELGTVAKAGLDRGARLLPYATNSAVVDHYRRLRTKILQQREIKPFKSLVVTSASPQEGKTVTVINLALSFSSLPNFKVVVIDGDLRRGTLGGWLGVSEDQLGLSNLLEGSAKLEDVVLKSDQIPMHFMVRGNAQVPDLHPSHFAGHFRRLSELYDLVLVDSPPVNLLADVQILAANSDAVLLVARAFSTTRKSLEKAAQELAPFRIIGSVLNAGVTPRSSKYYGYY